MMNYQRYLVPGSIPFSPVALAERTEKIVCSSDKRKYTDFYATGVYGGIATGYTVGCCLRCVYCWVDWSRDFPEKLGTFYSAESVCNLLVETARKFGVRKARISGAEPTIGKNHLLRLLELIEDSNIKLFILETNGILFGADNEYVKKVSNFSKVHIRVSLKAASPEGFTQRTGAIGKYVELPFTGIKNLKNAGASFHVAAMTDTRIMPSSERKILIEKLSQIDLHLAIRLEEEIIDPYETTLTRLKYANVKLRF